MGRGRMRPVHGFLVAALLVLGACGTDEWFGSEGEPPLPGERIAVLPLDRAIDANPELQGTPVTLPMPFVNEIWPQTGGTSEHAPGHLSAGGELKRAWEADAGEGSGSTRKVVASPIVADGRVFVMDASTTIRAFDLKTGDRVWSKELAPDDDDEGFGGGIAYAGGRLFVSTGFAEAMALDAGTGDIVWRRRIASPSRAAPTVADGRVFVVTIDNRTDALDAGDGSTLWFHTGAAETASLLGGAPPAVSQGAVIAAYSSGEVVALREENGRVLWTDNLAAVRRTNVVSALADIRAAPVANGGRVFAVSFSGRMAAIDMRSGGRAWDQPFGGIQMPWLAGDYLYLVTYEADLLCLRASDGAVRWINRLPRYEDMERRRDPLLWAGPLLVDGRLILVGNDGRVVQVSATTGEEIGSFDLGESHSLPPIAAGGTILFLSDDATLRAYR